MAELDKDEYRKIHQALGGHPDNFDQWFVFHQEWEAQRTKPRSEKPQRPRKKSGGKRSAKVG